MRGGTADPRITKIDFMNNIDAVVGNENTRDSSAILTEQVDETNAI